MSGLLHQHLHPDALFDEPYAEAPLDVSGYRGGEGPWRPVETDAHGITCASADGYRLRVDCCTPNILRLRWAPPGAAIGPSTTERLGLVDTAFPGCPCEAEADPARIALAAGNLRFELDTGAGTWRCHDVDGTVLLANREPVRFGPEPEFGGLRYHAAFALDDEERLHGGGGRIHPLARRGSTADVFGMKAGHISGDYGGFPLPWFLSTRGYGVFLNNPWPHVYLDLGHCLSSRWWLHAPGGDCDLFVIRGPTHRELVRRFTSIVGRIPTPQRWWLGYWCSSLGFKSDAEVLACARRFRREGYPLEAMVLDGPWRGGPEFLEKYMTDGEYPSNDLEWHPDFGDGPAMVEALAGLGVKTVLHQNSRNFKAATIEAGLAAGHLRRQGEEVVVRFGEPAAEAWYRAQLGERDREGVALWWLDHGDRVSGELAPGLPSRNLFGALWARCVDAAAREGGADGAVCLIRGCGIGGQRHAIPWPGDTRFGIDYFEEDVWFCLNAGLSGFPLTSADLGGFYDRGRERGDYNRAFDVDNLARRVCQALFFLPVPRVHGDDSAPPKIPWNCPPAVAALYRRMLTERYRLIPYLFHHLWEAHLHGDPLLRPMVWAYPGDAELVDLDDQFLLGADLLVAPVLRQGMSERTLRLPPGRWYDYWRDVELEGDRELTVPTPLCAAEGLPVFVRAGAILALQPPVHSLDDAPPALLELHCYPGGDTELLLHEGPGADTLLVQRREGTGGELRVANPLEGERAYRVVLHAAPAVTAILDGAVVPASDLTRTPTTTVVDLAVPAGGERCLRWR